MQLGEDVVNISCDILNKANKSADALEKTQIMEKRITKFYLDALSRGTLSWLMFVLKAFALIARKKRKPDIAVLKSLDKSSLR